jgi:hypothetical protein
MSLQQAVYTSCSPGRGYRGQGGFDVLAWSPQFPLVLVDTLAPHLASTGTTTLWSAHWLDAHGWVLIAVTPAGNDPTTGRPGNFIAHLVLAGAGDGPISPQQVATWPGWITLPSQLSDTVPIHPEWPQLASADQTTDLHTKTVNNAPLRSMVLTVLSHIMTQGTHQLILPGARSVQNDAFIVLQALLPRRLRKHINWCQGAGQAAILLADEEISGNDNPIIPPTPWMVWINDQLRSMERWAWDPRGTGRELSTPQDLDTVALMEDVRWSKGLTADVVQQTINSPAAWLIVAQSEHGPERVGPVLSRLQRGVLTSWASAIGNDDHLIMSWLVNSLLTICQRSGTDAVSEVNKFCDQVLPVLAPPNRVIGGSCLTASKLAGIICLNHLESIPPSARGALLNRISDAVMERVKKRIPVPMQLSSIAVPLPNPDTADIMVVANILWAAALSSGDVPNVRERILTPLAHQRPAAVAIAFEIMNTSGGDYATFLVSWNDCPGIGLNKLPGNVLRQMMTTIDQWSSKSVQTTFGEAAYKPVLRMLIFSRWMDKPDGMLAQWPAIVRLHRLADIKAFSSASLAVITKLLSRHPEESADILTPLKTNAYDTEAWDAIKKHAKGADAEFAKVVIRVMLDASGMNTRWTARRNFDELFADFQTEDSWWVSAEETDRLRPIYKELRPYGKISMKGRWALVPPPKRAGWIVGICFIIAVAVTVAVFIGADISEVIANNQSKQEPRKPDAIPSPPGAKQ